MSGLFVVVFPIEGLISPPRMRRMAMDQIGPMLEQQRITLSEGRWHWRVEFDGRDRYLVAQHAAKSTAPQALIETRARALADAVGDVIPTVARLVESGLAEGAAVDAAAPAVKPRACTVDGCDGKIKGRGLCNRHYARARAHGDPTAGRLPYGDAPARLDELEHLLDLGVVRDEAVRRCGWGTRATALRAAQREKRRDLAAILRRSELAGVTS